MFNRTFQPTEAQKTQIVIDYLVSELAFRQSHAPEADITNDVEMMLRIQRRKLKILNKKRPRK